MKKPREKKPKAAEKKDGRHVLEVVNACLEKFAGRIEAQEKQLVLLKTDVLLLREKLSAMLERSRAAGA